MTLPVTPGLAEQRQAQCISLLFGAVINAMTKRNLGEKRVYLAYSSQSQPIIEGSQGRTSSRSRGHGGVLLSGLLPMACSVILLRSTSAGEHKRIHCWINPCILPASLITALGESDSRPSSGSAGGAQFAWLEPIRILASCDMLAGIPLHYKSLLPSPTPTLCPLRTHCHTTATPDRVIFKLSLA